MVVATSFPVLRSEDRGIQGQVMSNVSEAHTSSAIVQRHIDWSRGTVTNGGGAPATLRPQALAVLKFLTERPGQVVTKDELMAAIWQGIAVTDDSLVQCVTEIRKALGDDRHVIIKTVPKRGYIYEVYEPISQAEDKSRRPWQGLAAVICGAAVLATADYHLRSPQATVSPEISIAVLPFINLGSDTKQGFLAAGITEDLTTELASIPNLIVISSSAVSEIKSISPDASPAAGELRVRYILRGNLRLEGGQLRINAQLIDAETASQLWAKHFEGSWDDVFNVRDQVIDGVVTSLRLRVYKDSDLPQTAGGTSNPAAYEAYLQALGAWIGGQPADYVAARTFYQQALDIDPEFGAAAAELAYVYYSSYGQRAYLAALGVTDSEAIAKSYSFQELAAKRPSAPYYQLRSEILLRERKFEEAIVAAERAIALDSSNRFSYHAMSYALILGGRADDGLGFLKAAERVDPNWTPWRYYLAALGHASRDRFEEAAGLLEKLEKAPQAADHFTRYLALELLISVYGHLNQMRDAQRARKKLENWLPEVDVPTFTISRASADLPFKNAPDRERILEGLRKAGIR
jgi:adenylate cyclase